MEQTTFSGLTPDQNRISNLCCEIDMSGPTKRSESPPPLWPNFVEWMKKQGYISPSKKEVKNAMMCITYGLDTSKFNAGVLDEARSQLAKRIAARQLEASRRPYSQNRPSHRYAATNLRQQQEEADRLVEADYASIEMRVLAHYPDFDLALELQKSQLTGWQRQGLTVELNTSLPAGQKIVMVDASYERAIVALHEDTKLAFDRFNEGRV